MRLFILSFLCLPLICVPSGGWGASAEDGGALFQDHCAACHGADALGNGPMAPVLTIFPPDLTGLSARAGGEFPAADVVRWVDGRDTIPAHGGPMPLFGPLLEGESAVLDAPDGSPIFTTSAILAIVEWLESVQAE